MKPETFGDLEEGARGALALLIDAVAERAGTELPMAQFSTEACANCGAPRPLRSPYCSNACRQVAGFVRQMRQALATDALEDRERQVMKGEVFWRLLGGGLPRREAKIPERSRLAVLKAQDFRCQVCGGEADRVENTGTG